MICCDLRSEKFLTQARIIKNRPKVEKQPPGQKLEKRLDFSCRRSTDSDGRIIAPLLAAGTLPGFGFRPARSFVPNAALSVSEGLLATSTMAVPGTRARTAAP
jgi:hypothetical protein